MINVCSTGLVIYETAQGKKRNLSKDRFTDKHKNRKLSFFKLKLSCQICLIFLPNLPYSVKIKNLNVLKLKL